MPGNHHGRRREIQCGLQVELFRKPDLHRVVVTGRRKIHIIRVERYVVYVAGVAADHLEPWFISTPSVQRVFVYFAGIVLLQVALKDPDFVVDPSSGKKHLIRLYTQRGAWGQAQCGTSTGVLKLK